MFALRTSTCLLSATAPKTAPVIQNYFRLFTLKTTHLEKEFENLKGEFGPEGRANELTFTEFVALPEERANKLLSRECVSDKVAGKLAALRLSANSQQQTQQVKYALDVVHDSTGRFRRVRDGVDLRPTYGFLNTLQTEQYQFLEDQPEQQPPQGFQVPPIASVRDRLLPLRVLAGTSFVDLLNSPLPLKIPIQNLQIINQFSFFEYSVAEYKFSLDVWLDHQLLSLTSEQAVVILDGMWQGVMKSIANVAVLLDEHDASSQNKVRPDFTAMFKNCLVMKGEAKASRLDMMASSGDLTRKFHKHAFKLFPKGCFSIPGVATCNEMVDLYAITFFNGRFSQHLVKQYNVSELRGRVDFIVDIFKILIWILSQTEPTEGSHLIPDVRRKTRNGHHIALLEEGILKGFDEHKLHNIQIATIGSIYALNLPNVEHGRVNCKSITITRVGSRLTDAVRARHMDKTSIFDQISSGINQLHANGFAHCDICVDNVFVDTQEDGGAVFLGDLEYCRGITEKPPADIRSADPRAKTAGELDLIQLEKLKDELASI